MSNILENISNLIEEIKKNPSPIKYHPKNTSVGKPKGNITKNLNSIKKVNTGLYPMSSVK